MSTFIWSKSYSVGVEEIDRQHKELFDMINHCHSKFEEKDVTAPKRILVNLMEYALNHFRTEEKYFDMFNYPDSEAHKNEHKAFEDKVNEFRMAYQTKGTFNAPLVHGFIKDWVIQHILICDRKYKTFFKEHGLK